MEEKTYQCEFCGKQHDGLYGAGRFCSKSCASKFANNPENRITKEQLISGDYDFPYTSKIRNWLFKFDLKEKRCECCGNTEWLGQPIVLELHHIDGNRKNNKLDNIQILCPNCHSQTDNWKSKNHLK